MPPFTARGARFDPWFNYRATEFMAANGWDKFQVRALPWHPRRAARPGK